MTEKKTHTLESGIARFCARLEDKKGMDVIALDVSKICSAAEGMIMVTAGSARHAQAMADDILDLAGEEAIPYLGMEGYQGGLWILVDFNDILVHIFQKDTREFYNLEGLWGDGRVLHSPNAS